MKDRCQYQRARTLSSNVVCLHWNWIQYKLVQVTFSFGQRWLRTAYLLTKIKEDLFFIMFVPFTYHILWDPWLTWEREQKSTEVTADKKGNENHGSPMICERKNWCCLGSRSKGVGWPKGKKTKHCINRLIKSKSISLFRLKFLKWKKKKAVTGSSDCWKSFHNLPRVLS